MKAIKIEIIEFISNDQPGFVECKFFDAWDKEHRVQEKISVVTEKDLNKSSVYPQDGIIACEVTEIWIDINNRKLFTVTTEKPWGIDSIDGLNKFDLLEWQLIEFER